MNASRSQLKIQFDRVVENGWLPIIQEAGEKYDIPIKIVLGLGSREGNWDPKWLRQAGDHGNGYGLLQADKRSFPEFVKSGKWKDARECIFMGAQIYTHKRDSIRFKVPGSLIVATTLAGKTYKTEAKAVPSWQLNYVALAAYNSGAWAHYHFSKNGDCDLGTTGKDYAHDTAERAEVFGEFLKNLNVESFAAIASSENKNPETGENSDTSGETASTPGNQIDASSAADSTPAPKPETIYVNPAQPIAAEGPKASEILHNSWGWLLKVSGAGSGGVLLSGIIAKFTGIEVDPHILQYILLAIVGCVFALILIGGLLGLIFIINKFKATARREQYAHEQNMAMLSAARDPNSNNVILGKQPVVEAAN